MDMQVPRLTIGQGERKLHVCPTLSGETFKLNCLSLYLQLTLYFHQVLSEHASVYDMKHLAGKLDVDYVSR